MNIHKIRDEDCITKSSTLLQLRVGCGGYSMSENEYRTRHKQVQASIKNNIQRRDDVVNFMTSDDWNNSLPGRKISSSELREEVEDETHLLVDCPYYQIWRKTMWTEVHKTLTQGQKSRLERCTSRQKKLFLLGAKLGSTDEWQNRKRRDQR